MNGDRVVKHQGMTVRADENRGQEKRVPAAVLQAAFWSALEDCESPPYLGTAENGDDGLIDGYLAAELWERMADDLETRWTP